MPRKYSSGFIRRLLAILITTESKEEEIKVKKQLLDIAYQRSVSNFMV
jgi:hypothetical protein